MQRRILFMLLLALLAARLARGPALAAQAPGVQAPAASGPAPVSAPSAAVRALLERAGKEAPETALQTLAEAQKQAESSKDTAGQLAIAAKARDAGWTLFVHGDLPGAKRYFQLLLGISERLAPGSLDLAFDLNGLASVLSR